MAFKGNGHTQERRSIYLIPGELVGSHQATHNRRGAAAQTSRQGDMHAQRQVQPWWGHAHACKERTCGPEHQVSIIAG
jgi:hypothetical protein